MNTNTWKTNGTLVGEKQIFVRLPGLSHQSQAGEFVDMSRPRKTAVPLLFLSLSYVISLDVLNPFESTRVCLLLTFRSRMYNVD
jgi:hypothetical protein